MGRQDNIDSEKKFSQKFEDEVKQIFADLLIQRAPDHVDWNEATDLTIMQIHPFDIGVRIRRHKYLEDYGDEITMRYKRSNGKKTEWDKLVDGKGDYYFYGFCDEDEEKICAYNILDLTHFRAQLVRNTVDYHVIERRKGQADFAAVDVNSLNDRTLVQRHGFSS